jgi:hypothetical protein
MHRKSAGKKYKYYAKNITSKLTNTTKNKTTSKQKYNYNTGKNMPTNNAVKNMTPVQAKMHLHLWQKIQLHTGKNTTTIQSRNTAIRLAKILLQTMQAKYNYNSGKKENYTQEKIQLQYNYITSKHRTSNNEGRNMTPIQAINATATQAKTQLQIWQKIQLQL